MTTYNLITMLGEQVSGIEPIVCEDQQDAVAYSCGVLTERTKIHAEMYANLGVHWMIEEGERFLGDATVPAGRNVGAWRLVFSEGRPRLMWADAVRSGGSASPPVEP